MTGDDRRVELRHLEYFVAVAEELSFTRASRRLHVVQSGVSSAIQVLERELGAALFDRDRHRVTLTEAGEALLPEARATLAAAQAAAEAVAEATTGLRGTLTIGTMLTTGSIDVPALLGRFHERHPAVLVRLRAVPGGSAELAREVISGALDLALLALPGRTPPGLTLRPLAREPLVLICGPEHPLAAAGEATLEALANETFVDVPVGWGSRAIVDRAFAAAGLERQVSFEVSEFGTAAGLVRNGLGVAFVPTSAVRTIDGVIALPVTSVSLDWQVLVATSATRRPTAAARAFLADLIASALTASTSSGLIYDACFGAVHDRARIERCWSLTTLRRPLWWSTRDALTATWPGWPRRPTSRGSRCARTRKRTSAWLSPGASSAAAP